METSFIYLSLLVWDGAEPPASSYEIENVAYTSLRDISLEQVKKTGKIIFPFAQSGKKYRISATFFGISEGTVLPDDRVPITVNTECVAGNGIFFDTNMELVLNDANTGAALNSEPVFSSKVTFAPVKYSYQAMISCDGYGFAVLNDEEFQDSLQWGFEPRLTNRVREFNFLESGDHPAFVNVCCNIIYDNITWGIQIAKTPLFTYSFF